MARSHYISSLGRLRPPVRRVLAIDAGGRRLKLLLAQTEFGRLRILRQEMVDLHAEGLVSPEEVQTHLQASLQEWGRPPLALVLPQHISISQIVDLPATAGEEQEKLIQDEIVKLGGVSESRIVYDFVRVDSPGRADQQFWVTMCQETEIRDRILRLGLQHEDLCDVTTTANALISAYRAVAPGSRRTVLVHAGAQTTVLIILVDGRVAYASSFQMGGDFFTRALARSRNISEEDAEILKRTSDVFTSSQQNAEFLTAVEGWTSELKGQLKDWFTRNSTAGVAPQDVEMIASGGTFQQPGLIDHLSTRGVHLQSWPTTDDAGNTSPGFGFEVAYGAALQALGHTAQGVSLLPDDYRQAWQRRMVRQRVEWASFLLLLLTVIALSIGTWRNLSLITRKSALLDKVQAATYHVDSNQALANELLDEYEKVRHVFRAQRTTIDSLQALALLQQTRSNQPFWYVLVADQQSYFSQPAALLSTNRPSGTNLPPLDIAPLMASSLPPTYVSATGTNPATAKPGLIAELCIPQESEAARKTLSDLVRNLKQQPMFSKVDLLSEDLRRNLTDSRLVLPEKYFALSLDFLETAHHQPVTPRRATNTVARPPRRTARTGIEVGPELPGYAPQ